MHHFKPHITLYLIFISLLFSQFSEAQIEINSGVMPVNLIEGTFLGDGIEVLDITFRGAPASVGLFTDGQSEIGINNGLVMSTGIVEEIGQAAGNLIQNDFSNAPSTPQDADLNAISTDNQFDISIFTIRFKPFSDTLRFTYVFASEEYPEFPCAGVNDVFGFFISGPNPAGGNYVSENIAIVPGTNLPVAIDNVHPQNPDDPACTPLNEQFYNNNSSPNLAFDGFLNVFIAEAIVEPCQEYTMKLAIADIGDAVYDSGIFLEAKSFGTGSLRVDVESESIDGVIAEGCSSTKITFSTNFPAEDTIIIDYSLIGTANLGIDYTTDIVDPLMIPKGESSVEINIVPLEDGLAESFESILFDVRRNICGRDTIPVFIRDQLLKPVGLPTDTTICAGEQISLIPQIEENIPPSPFFSSDDTIYIDNSNFDDPVISTISIDGLFGALDVGLIDKVCVDIDHTVVDDLDIYLLSPCGNIMLLTSDNGGTNMDYKNTCFTTTAVNNIVSGSAPFTGDFFPESDWTLLTNGGCATTGDWTLIIIDDAGAPGSPIPISGIGFLNGWSIQFNQFYTTDFAWTPPNGLSCVQCDTTLASPFDTTKYIFTIRDSYGCVEADSINVNIQNTILAPILNCVTPSDSTVTVSWSNVPGADIYLISVDAGPFIPVGTDTFFTVNNLSPLDMVNIRVVGRSIGFPCAADTASIQCQALLCAQPDVIIASGDVIDISCSGQTDGSVTVTFFDPPGTFNFTVGGVSNQSGIFLGLQKGTDTVYVESLAGCTAKLPFEIMEPEVISVTGIVQPAPCAESLSGGVDVTVTGGTEPYIFEWFSLGALVSSDEDLQNVRGTSYSFFVTDANGCSVNQFFTVPVISTLKVTGELVAPRCRWEASGSITARISGGFEPYSISWKDTAEISNDISINNVITGNYRVVVMDSSGCRDSTFFFMPNPDKVNANFEVTDVSCFGDNNGAVVVKPFSGVPPFLYRQLGTQAQQSRVFFKLPPGLQQYEITDSRGCKSEVFPIIVSAPDSFVVDIGNEVTVPFGESINVSPQLMGGSSNVSWLWNSNVPIPELCDSCREQSFVAISDAVLSVSVMDENGCLAEGNLIVRIKEDKIILVPTAFTPNGDFANDQLIVHGSEGAFIEEFRIFDRWGGLIFERTDFLTNDVSTFNWNGEIDGDQAQSGVYIWKAVVRFRDMSKLNFQGETNLIR